MTDDLRELEAQLEQATRRGSDLGDNLPPETAALRAGWLALEGLLDAAQTETQLPLSQLPPAPARHFRRVLVAAVAALAASVLIAATMTTYFRNVGPIRGSISESSGIASNGGDASEPQRQQVVFVEPKQEEPDQAVGGNGEIAWDDSLDDEVESVRQAFRHTQHEDFALASAASDVQYQLELLQIELDESSL